MREFKVTKSFVYVHEMDDRLEITCFIKGGSIFLTTDALIEHYFVVNFDRYRTKQIESNDDCLEEVPVVDTTRDDYRKRAGAIERDFVVHKRIMKI